MGDIGPVRRHIEVLPTTKPVLPAQPATTPNRPTRPQPAPEPSR